MGGKQSQESLPQFSSHTQGSCREGLMCTKCPHPALARLALACLSTPQAKPRVWTQEEAQRSAMASSAGLGDPSANSVHLLSWRSGARAGPRPCPHLTLGSMQHHLALGKAPCANLP